MDMIKFKCWYYDMAIKDGSEEAVKAKPRNEMPDDIRKLAEVFDLHLEKGYAIKRYH